MLVADGSNGRGDRIERGGCSIVDARTTGCLTEALGAGLTHGGGGEEGVPVKLLSYVRN